MSFLKYNEKAPYYKIRPSETILRYLKRMLKSIIRMYPYAKTHGIRYYIDTNFRRNLSYHRRRRKKQKVRRSRAGSFNKTSVKTNLKILLIARDGQCCNLCKEALDWNDLTIDHILPLFIGGNSDMKNLQLLCRPCHEEKSRHEQKNSSSIVRD